MTKCLLTSWSPAKDLLVLRRSGVHENGRRFIAGRSRYEREVLATSPVSVCHACTSRPRPYGWPPVEGAWSLKPFLTPALSAANRQIDHTMRCFGLTSLGTTRQLRLCQPERMSSCPGTRGRPWKSWNVCSAAFMSGAAAARMCRRSSTGSCGDFGRPRRRRSPAVQRPSVRQSRSTRRVSRNTLPKTLRRRHCRLRFQQLMRLPHLC
jgi:hypothetical protein